jgi:hypothetical protein
VSLELAPEYNFGLRLLWHKSASFGGWIALTSVLCWARQVDVIDGTIQEDALVLPIQTILGTPVNHVFVAVGAMMADTSSVDFDKLHDSGGVRSLCFQSNIKRDSLLTSGAAIFL